MRVSIKKISLNSAKSRIPGIIPSIRDTWTLPDIYSDCFTGGTKFYSYSEAVRAATERNINVANIKHGAEFYEFTNAEISSNEYGNHGMIPSDIIIPENIADKVTDLTDIYVNIPDGNGGYYDLSDKDSYVHYDGRRIISGDTEIKILTYKTLMDWYIFFEKYQSLIKNPSYARYYDTALDYYLIEVEDHNEHSRSIYEEMDALYESRGGDAMYEWINKNCIVKFAIPEQFVYEWKTTYLYYPQAIQKYLWFKEMSSKYSMVSVPDDCKSTDNCCECQEFVRLGGHDFYYAIKEWVDKLGQIDFSYATKEASMVIPVFLGVSIEDLGEMSIFSEEWVEERDYHNTIGSSSGTIVSRPYITEEDGSKTTLDDIYMIKDNTSIGYEYNEYFENVFNPVDWFEHSYTDLYMDSHRDEFVASGIVQSGNEEIITSYTFSPVNGKVVYNPQEITETIFVPYDKSVFINGSVYKVYENAKYVNLCYGSQVANTKLKNGYLPIYADESLEYALFNGKKYFVKTDKNGEERVYFLKNLNCYDEGCKVISGASYIIYNDALYFVKNGVVSIQSDNETKIYPTFDAMTDLGGELLVIKDEMALLQNRVDYTVGEMSVLIYTFGQFSDKELKKYSFEKEPTVEYIDGKGYNVTFYYEYPLYMCQTISGYCDSKLDLVRRRDINVDEMGNELPGYFNVEVEEKSGGHALKRNSSHYNMPYDGCRLDLPFYKGCVTNLNYDESLSSNDDTIYSGNIITSIKFFYLDEFGERKFETEADFDFSCLLKERTEKNPQCDDWFLHMTCSEAIDLCRLKKKNCNNWDVSDDPCAFFEEAEEHIEDILYCEIIYHIGASIIKKEGLRNGRYTYELYNNSGVKYTDISIVEDKNGSFYKSDGSTFTFKYYEATHETGNLPIDKMPDYMSGFELARFEMPVYLYKINTNSKPFIGFEKNNDVIVSPLFRTEYNLASSSMQNVDADIYIDRGINAAFEKHLKLQEIRTMEALENYGNSWFKINDN